MLKDNSTLPFGEKFDSSVNSEGSQDKDLRNIKQISLSILQIAKASG